MFDKPKELIYYKREHYTFAEKLYEQYVSMRKTATEFENIKYNNEFKDSFILSQEGKEGFLAGVYVMLSLMGDM